MLAAVFCLSFLLFLVEVKSQPDFPYVSFMGRTLANHSYVNHNLVGNDRNGENSVQCHTDLSTCCSAQQGQHRGYWYIPAGNQLPSRNHISQGKM